MNWRVIPAFLWLIFIFVLCNLRPSALPSDAWFVFSGIDKVVHASFYIIYSWLFIPVFMKNRTMNQSVFFTVISGFLYGVFIELMQHFVFTYRSADWRDVVANSIGLSIGIFSFPIIQKIFLRFNRSLL